MSEDTMTETADLLLRPRVRQRLITSQKHVTHILLEETIPASAHPGMWTRRAWERRALCGSMRAMVIGQDAEDWFVERAPITARELTQVDCKRCVSRYHHWLKQSKR